MGTGLLTNANPSVRSISAFFPCYNDVWTIESMVRAAGDALVQLVDDFEVIVVDDGSADDSVAVLERLQAQLPWLRVVVHESNRGYGGALRSGFAACTKDWIFYTDGDGQYDPSEVARLARVVRPDVGLAQGWKLQRGDGRARAIIGRAYHHLVAWAFGLGTRDTDCDFRLFRRSLVAQTSLQSDSGAICVEMMYRFAEAGAAVRRDTCAPLPTPVRAQPVLPGPSPSPDVRGARRLVGSASPALRAAWPTGRGSDGADRFRLVDPRPCRGGDRDRGPVARRAPLGLDA